MLFLSTLIGESHVSYILCQSLLIIRICQAKGTALLGSESAFSLFFSISFLYCFLFLPVCHVFCLHFTHSHNKQGG
jgi:hypothetical protein